VRALFGESRLDRTKLRVITDLGNLYTRPIDDIDQAFTALRFVNYTIDYHCYHLCAREMAASSFPVV
jgi:hypothetical protein